MTARRRKPRRAGFGEDGGSNVAEYMGLAERVPPSASELVVADHRIVPVQVDLIDPSPHQTRVDFDPDELKALAEDIRTNGLSQAITLRRKPDDRYELVAGERRWRAARLGGHETVHARVRDLDDFAAHLIGVSENNQRANLSPWEKALEALELQRHAEAEGRPHSQRDLARYLNRNVSVVNQQLAIARAVTSDVPGLANVSARDLCQLPHQTLHRIAKLPRPKRPDALADAVARRRTRRSAPGRDADGTRPPALPEKPKDPWTRLWERGGLKIHIRKPLRDLDPAKARSYLQDLLPGVGALAVRATQENGGSPLVRWEHERGRLLFLRPAEQLDAQERSAAKEALERMIRDLSPTP